MRTARARFLALTLCLTATGGSLFWLLRTRPPNLVIILADTLRADRLGAYGSPTGRTPFLDGLAARGVVFSRAYAPSSWTTPSVASLFTATYPSTHGVVFYGARLPATPFTLAERLRGLGYRSAGFSTNFLINQSLGFARGFDRWQTILGPSDREIKVRGEKLRRRAIGWLDAAGHRHAGGTFLYLHYMEPHGPYQPPAAFRQPPPGGRAGAVHEPRRTRSAAATRALGLYDGEVAALDAEIEQLFAELRRRGFLDRTIVAFTSDHGEEFDEHGGLGHGRTVFNESIHVPLILVGAGLPAGRVVDRTVSLVDLAPTLLELVGAPATRWGDGRSLVPLIRGHGHPATAALVRSELPRIAGSPEKRAHLAALIRQQTKLVLTLAGDLELYDLARDADERSPVNPERDGGSAALTNVLRTAVSRFPEFTSAPIERAPVDAATAERLRALGYAP